MKARGKNTNNTLQELEVILYEMRKGGFDYDGVDPGSMMEDVKEDIEQLMYEGINPRPKPLNP